MVEMAVRCCEAASVTVRAESLVLAQRERKPQRVQ
jgi:hypothetical protein